MEISLSGIWKFRQDSKRCGMTEKFYLQNFTDNIKLPGTMEENGYGDVLREPSITDLNHTYFYRGWAWYQTEFTLSEEQAKQQITLFLERVQWDSFVWVDGNYIGNQNSLSTPHCYSLSDLSAGMHKLVILIDNSNLRADSQFMKETAEEGTDSQGRNLSLHLHTPAAKDKKIACGLHGEHYAFNGIAGELKLIIKPQVNIQSIDIIPDIHNRTVTAKISIKNNVQYRGSAKLSVSCEHANSQADIILNGEKEQEFCLKLLFYESMRLWDEFGPFIYTFTVCYTAGDMTDVERVHCGLRELKTEGQHIFINGNRLFLRTTLEGAAFPYTGYPPTDEAFWLRAFTILKSYGLNGVRAHTFVPPKACFDAAEKLGFYLQIELPGTSCPNTDEPPEVTAFLWQELKQTLKLYGNYACFLFMSMGNEQLVSSDKEMVARHQRVLMDKVAYAQQTDPRHLYACTSHNYTDGRNDDFYVVATKDELVLNGISWGGPDPITTSRFSKNRPSTMETYQEGVTRMNRPVITHEVGQWAVYPNFAEMPKYTGVLKPRNYEVFAAELDKNGILHQNADFVRNSGALSLLLYKEEIESALRSPDLSGFQLLDIHDYPGQGTSTIGILDCFFDSKGLITPEEYRCFCASAVPLCSFEKYVYSCGENMNVTPMIANYTNAPINSKAILTVVSADGNVIYEHCFNTNNPKGQLTKYPSLNISLSCTQAVEAIITLSLPEKCLKNSWKFWIYPEEVSLDMKGLIIVTELDERTEKILERGENILYIQPYGKRPKNGVQGSVTTQFWNPYMKAQETANGILCNPDHPIFKNFPTESHTNFQWWEILKESYFINIDKMPKDYFPIVQVIPGIKTNNKMGLIWECRVGNGNLLICCADLRNFENRPVAKQLLYSICNYMKSEEFAPEREISLEVLKELFS